jgi:hypothetical protein
MRRTAAVLFALATVTACGGGSDPTASSEPTATKSATPTKASTPKATRCVVVALADMQRIATGAEKDVGKMTFTKAAAVKSNDFSSVYMIAGRFTAPGVDEVGVWATNALPIGSGLLMSVDGFAKQFTVWPDADKTQAKISSTDDGVDEAKDCL